MHHPFCPREYLLTVHLLETHHPFHAGHSYTPHCPPLNVGGVGEVATAVITLWFCSLDSLKLIQKVSVSYFWPSLREEVCLPPPSSYSPAALNAWCCLPGRLGVFSANQGGKGYSLTMSASHARFPYVRLHLSAVDRYLPPETWKGNFSMRPKKKTKTNLFKN